MLKTHERIITSEDLAQQVQVAISNAQQEPLVVTENGRPTAYLISIALFDALAAKFDEWELAELVDNIAIAEAQFKKGQFKTLEQAQAIAEAAWAQAA